jgi:hypothetical protein
MAKWDTGQIYKVVRAIEDNVYVLPVIQRRLVWDIKKMELLFDSLLKGNSFGGVMVLDERRNSKPLFAFRPFSKHGELTDSVLLEQLDHDTCLVIDGQQRLQTFYMGLRSSYNGMRLYFNLLSNSLEYDFRFTANPATLPEAGKDEDEQPVETLWYSVSSLYYRLQQTHNSKQTAAEIAESRHIQPGPDRELLETNVHQFYRAVFEWEALGISSVLVNSSRPDEERQRIVELFRRVNDGGTRLTALDLVASKFKGFDHNMERFFNEVEHFSDIGISQDEVIKLIFLLQDDHARQLAQVTPEDAHFAIANQSRIIAALKGTRQFLHNAGLYNYYHIGGRSDIPLYFIAYHIYHKTLPAEKLEQVYENYDTNNPDFLHAKRWIYLSLLNGVFRRGSGWIPYLTGIRKILSVMRQHKNKPFPTEELFNVYTNHPVQFREAITVEHLPSWDSDFVFYLLYQDARAIVSRDIDHIHPKSLLEISTSPEFSSEQIHTIANYQLLDANSNRNEKRAKPLDKWMENYVEDAMAYRKRHFIPEQPELWQTGRFIDFLAERTKRIVEKVREMIPGAISKSVVEAAKEDARPAEAPIQLEVTDARAILLAQIPDKYRQHPILGDGTTWFTIYGATGCGPKWLSRITRELGYAHIETVADFALKIMALGLEATRRGKRGMRYRFARPLAESQSLVLNTKHFGGWSWSIALDELEKRDFDWREFLASSTPTLFDYLVKIELTPQLQEHPVLKDETELYDVYWSSGAGRRWSGSFRREMSRLGINTIGNLAHAIAIMGLEHWQESGYGPIYRFWLNPIDGHPVELDTSKFGAWGWKVTLDELDRRDFPWRNHLTTE